jgi:hypothetical protein
MICAAAVQPLGFGHLATCFHWQSYRESSCWATKNRCVVTAVSGPAVHNYRYRADLFPNSRFRMAYDRLQDEHASEVARRAYLRILEIVRYMGLEKR